MVVDLSKLGGGKEERQVGRRARFDFATSLPCIIEDIPDRISVSPTVRLSLSRGVGMHPRHMTDWSFDAPGPVRGVACGMGHKGRSRPSNVVFYSKNHSIFALVYSEGISH